MIFLHFNVMRSNDLTDKIYTPGNIELMNMKHICVFGFLLDGAEHLFQQYISYIVAVSFVGGGNQRTRRKPSTSRKLLTTFIT